MENLRTEKKQLFRCLPPLFSTPHPWLVMTNKIKNNQGPQTFYNISQARHYTQTIPELCSKYVWDCHNGWVVLEDYDSDDCSLLNIVSMEKLQLPPLLDSASVIYESCIMLSSSSSSSPTTDPNCRIIFYTSDGNYLITCHAREDETFIKQELEIEENEDCYGMLTHVAVLEDKIYGWVLPQKELVVADFTEPSHFRKVSMELDLTREIKIGFAGYYLVESCGDILLVGQVGLGQYEVLEFRVFRADFSNLVWVKMESIGDRAIFLDDRYQGFSCSTAGLDNVRSNSIYFTYPNDRNLYVFDLEDRSTSQSLPSPIISSRHLEHIWIKVPGSNNV